MKTPTRNRGLHNRLKHSEPSAGMYTEVSFSDNSSTENAETSDNIYLSRKRKVNKSAYCEELESCKKEIGRLKVKLLRMKGTQFVKKPQDDYCLVTSKEMSEKLKKQREFLEKQYKVKLKKQKEEITRQLMRDLELSRDSIKDGNKNRAKELEEFYQNEIILIEKEHEAKLRIKVNQIKAEYERNLQRSQEENSSLKKQVELLKKQLEDSLARAQVKNTRTETTIFNTYESEKEFKTLNKKYSELQRDYLNLKNRPNDSLCVKCKAFTRTDQSLNAKIEKLKYLLDNDT
jgi:hypothetical protein